MAVCGGGDDCGGGETDEDEEGAGDAGVGFGEAVRLEDLVEEGGDAVEETDVDAEGEEDDPEFDGAAKFEKALGQGNATDVEGGAGRRGWKSGNEE